METPEQFTPEYDLSQKKKIPGVTLEGVYALPHNWEHDREELLLEESHDITTGPSDFLVAEVGLNVTPAASANPFLHGYGHERYFDNFHHPVDFDPRPGHEGHALVIMRRGREEGVAFLGNDQFGLPQSDIKKIVRDMQKTHMHMKPDELEQKIIVRRVRARARLNGAALTPRKLPATFFSQHTN